MGGRLKQVALSVALAALCAVPALARAQEPRAASHGAPGAAVSQDVAVADAADDAEERADGSVTLSSSDLELVDDAAHSPIGRQTVGIRFRGLNLPPDAIVSRAFVQFTSVAAGGTACALLVQGEAAANAPVFEEKAKNVSSRARTKAAVKWAPAPWPENGAGPAQQTPDLSSVVSEILRSPGWAAGNSLAIIITGQGVRCAASYDGAREGAPRLHVEWHRAAAAPAGPVPPSNRSDKSDGPTSPPAETAPQGSSTSQIVNALIDHAVETGSRLLDLPLFMLLGGVAVLGLLLVLVLGRLCRKGGRTKLFRAAEAVIGVLLVLAVAFLSDRKIARLEGEVSELRTRMNSDATALLDAVSKLDRRRKAFLFDPTEAESSLTKSFGEVKMMPSIYDEATDVVQVRRLEPVAQVYLAIVDLEHPAVEIKLDTAIKKKRLTTDFARENDCTVAINGEAGASSAPDCGFGGWIGNLIREGKPILLEDTKDRPFLSFDRKNHPTYSPAAIVDRTVTPEKYNVIWGRMDVLLGGNVVTADWRNQQPRTAMAINQAGTRLYLMVVDGRQANYSMGFTRADIGTFLKAFGAHDGMLCDEGGSSCIYLKSFGGIANIPSEGRGKERPTYTHFGIALNANK